MKWLKKIVQTLYKKDEREIGNEENKVKIVEKKVLGGVYKRVEKIEINGKAVEIKNSVANLYELEEFLKNFSVNELEYIANNVDNRNISGIALLAKLIKEGKVYYDPTKTLKFSFSNNIDERERKFAENYFINVFIFGGDLSSVGNIYFSKLEEILYKYSSSIKK